MVRVPASKSLTVKSRALLRGFILVFDVSRGWRRDAKCVRFLVVKDLERSSRVSKLVVTRAKLTTA